MEAGRKQGEVVAPRGRSCPGRVCGLAGGPSCGRSSAWRPRATPPASAAAPRRLQSLPAAREKGEGNNKALFEILSQRYGIYHSLTCTSWLLLCYIYIKQNW
ncbi:hypothetical protein CRUP_028492 [Coryphaenoides rupestris]|nr:hypothetical protein CRUP_028492 [Coryphaenoides rupestris]